RESFIFSNDCALLRTSAIRSRESLRVASRSRRSSAFCLWTARYCFNDETDIFAAATFSEESSHPSRSGKLICSASETAICFNTRIPFSDDSSFGNNRVSKARFDSEESQVAKKLAAIWCRRRNDSRAPLRQNDFSNTS